MNSLSLILAQGAPAGDAAAQQQPSLIGGLLPFIIIFVMIYFMMIRPQRRQQKEHQERLASLRSGDEVIAAGGIHGLVTNVSDRTITLKIADGVKIRVEKASVFSITKKSDDPAPAEPDATEVVATPVKN